jgi:hypothetical protein
MRLIAMRATKEDVASLGIELIKKNKYDFDLYEYLCNELDGTFMMYCKSELRENHETFNKQIFLEACGMGTPTLEEVKEYFKNAKTVKSFILNERCFTPDLSKLHYASHFGACIYDANSKLLYLANKGYATIILTKEKKFEITKEQILKYKMKYEFPECFVKGYTIKEAEETFKIKIIEKL